MNGLRRDGLARARALREHAAGGPPPCDVVLCPPATLLTEIGAIVANSAVALGAQDCHAAESGAHTGDLAATMLADVGCGYAIVGHSERRADHGERDADVAGKAAAAQNAGLIAVVCVGEQLAEREAGRALAVVGSQVAQSLPDGATPANTAIAYEPVWAIGSGRTPTEDEIAEVHAGIRQAWQARFSAGEEAVRVLYGGSVKASNAASILATAGVDGALVGGASLVAEDFWAICCAAADRGASR